MDFRIIKSPSRNVLNIIMKRADTKLDGEPTCTDAIGLIQGKMIDMIYAADLAEKAADVTVKDIRGNCPQHMIMMAVFGDTSSVESVIEDIKLNLEKR